MASDQTHWQDHNLTARNWQITLPVLFMSAAIRIPALHMGAHRNRGAAGYNHRVVLSLPPHRAAPPRLCAQMSKAPAEQGWLPTLCSPVSCPSTSSEHRPVSALPWSAQLLYLFPLDVVLDLGYLDLHGIQLLIRYQWDVGHCLRLIHHLETEVSERDVPLAVILLAFSERQEVQTFYCYWCLATPSPSHKLFPAIVQKILAQLHCDSHMEKVWQQAAFQQDSLAGPVAATAHKKATHFVIKFFSS